MLCTALLGLDTVGKSVPLKQSILTCSANATPTPDKLNSLDLPDDFFRIRLVCTVLDTCGVCFDRGAAKKKLDFFLTFFQVLSSSSCEMLLTEGV